jgi:hypothetical protein
MLKRLITKNKSKLIWEDDSETPIEYKSKEVYKDQDKILKRGITIPKLQTENIKVDPEELKLHYA